MDKQLIGFQTAKGGFANEHAIVAKFNNWKNDNDAQIWLAIMGYNLSNINALNAIQIPTKIKKADIEKYEISQEDYEKFVRFKKADIQIKLIIQVGEIVKIENISLKKSNSNADFNQVDKRTVVSYQEMWSFDDELALWFKFFTGELLTKNHQNLFENITLREQKRIFIDEMPQKIQNKIISFFEKNKILVVSDILRGRGGLAVEWILITRKNLDDTTTWILKDINTAMNFYGSGEVKISPRGSLIIGKIFLQRKGGTPDPTKLQFKFKPCDLFQLEN
ncbi:MAG: type II restriction endonuclease [Cytophagia bacterium]|nr:MAG: type II restriction endonuclease [Cytophagia bacterium]TAG44497.1 MAG: type II restriction endonuclease [Cytophagia bacterium]